MSVAFLGHLPTLTHAVDVVSWWSIAFSIHYPPIL